MFALDVELLFLFSSNLKQCFEVVFLATVESPSVCDGIWRRGNFIYILIVSTKQNWNQLERIIGKSVVIAFIISHIVTFVFSISNGCCDGMTKRTYDGNCDSPCAEAEIRPFTHNLTCEVCDYPSTSRNKVIIWLLTICCFIKELYYIKE